jgi:hypothetical protein
MMFPTLWGRCATEFCMKGKKLWKNVKCEHDAYGPEHCIGEIGTSEVFARWFHMISEITRNKCAWKCASEMWLFLGKILISYYSWLPVMSLVPDIMTWNQNGNCLESKAHPDWRNFTWCLCVEKWCCYCFLIPKALFFIIGTSEVNCEWWVLCTDIKRCFAECILAKGPEFLVKYWFYFKTMHRYRPCKCSVSRHGWNTCRTPTLQSRHCWLWFLGIYSA